MNKTHVLTVDKAWYKSKTVWGAGAVILYAIYKVLNSEPLHNNDIWVILGAFGVTAIGMRSAIGKQIEYIGKLLESAGILEKRL